MEVKARAEDLASVEERARELAAPAGFLDYQDTYFTSAGVEGYTHRRFRLREQEGGAWVTVKEKTGAEGAEASIEHEFEVSDPESFMRFAELFGFKVLVRKRKRGRRYGIELERMPGHVAVIELVEVEGLGFFVEVEVMVEDESMVEAATDEIRRIMERLGVPESAMEPAPYTYMLYKLGRPGEDAGWNG